MLEFAVSHSLKWWSLPLRCLTAPRAANAAGQTGRFALQLLAGAARRDRNAIDSGPDDPRRSDFCDKPVSSEGLDRYFTGPYQRTVLNGVVIFGGGPRSPLAGLVSQDASGASAYPVSCDRMPLRRR